MPSKTYSAEKTYPLTPAKIWDLLGNTEHLNRFIGLPSVEFGKPTQGPGGLYRPASARMGGMAMKWEEHPFDWIRDRFYGVLRLFEGSPLERFYGGIELFPEGAATRVMIYAEITPRNILGKMLAPVIGNKGCRDTLNYLDSYLKEEAKGGDDPLPRKPKTRTSRKTLDRLYVRLEAKAGSHPKLRRHLIQGTDEEVLGMRPGVLARRWKTTRETLVRLFLQATQEGLLTLRWDLICPNCRVSTKSYGSLKDVDKNFHCDVCGVGYEAELDQSVELRFSVHPTVRPADSAVYCLGGPSRAPHILIQRNFPPGFEADWEWDFGKEELRIRTIGSNRVVSMETGTGGDGSLSFKDGNWDRQVLAVPAGKGKVHLKNEGSEPMVAVLEKVERDPEAVTAAEIALFPEFRNLFSSEVLSPGREIGVRSLALLFTDLKGSTALYEQVGEASAFGRVTKHFDFMEKRITANGGTVVTTIGDAVMAAFLDPGKACRAALEIQRDLPDFNREQKIDPPLVLKIGLYCGPAIAMEANGRMDYFGRTVNIAARIQNESVGEDVVIPADWAREPPIARVLAAFHYKDEAFQRVLKGVEGEFPLVRLKFR